MGPDVNMQAQRQRAEQMLRDSQNSAKMQYASLQAKLAEMQLATATLAMWDDVQAQGIDPEQVQAFGWKDERLTLADERRLRRLGRRAALPSAATHLNYVRMRDDSIRPLSPPVLRPEYRR